ncbi:hypothetical protein [Streptomyces sp. HC307]|uniref:hypothetical protein n=1 Tax=Streptomyces flavusporus TaxID=3385496 RepID=UPI003916E9FA
MPSYKPCNPGSKQPRRRGHSPSTGVMLQGRAAGLGHWDDEIRSDGGKKKLHRIVRAREKAALRRAIGTGEEPC